MNFKKFLLEADYKQDLVNRIRYECGEMLAAYHLSQAVLLRGISGESGLLVDKPIRQDRKPVELSQKKHDLLHQLFLDHGLVATRKNSIFCSTSYSIAEDWGTVYIVFVKDGWTATVFDSLNGEYSYSELEIIASIDDDEAEHRDDEFSKLDPRSIKTSYALADSLKDQVTDIIVTGERYLALKANSPVTADILKMLGIKPSNLKMI